MSKRQKSTTTVTHPDGTTITVTTEAGGSDAPLEFFDPHFHIWDIREGSKTHDPKELFAPPSAIDNLYVAKDYEATFDDLDGFVMTGGVFVEAVSVCFVDTAAAALAPYCLAEAEFSARELAKPETDKDYRICATACLEDPDVEATLAKLAAIPAVRGIRQIVNYQPDWPRNKSAAVGNLLVNETWLNNFPLLEKYNLSFDLQLNPPQFASAAALVAQHPKTNIIINHLGSATFADLTEPDKAKVYWDGMAALAAAGPHVYIKLSMLAYADKAWDTKPVVTDAVLRLITLFGTERCFFASNFPVEGLADFGAWTAQRLLVAFRDMVAAGGHGRAVQQKLFASNAKQAYRF